MLRKFLLMAISLTLMALTFSTGFDRFDALIRIPGFAHALAFARVVGVVVVVIGFMLRDIAVDLLSRWAVVACMCCGLVMVVNPAGFPLASKDFSNLTIARRVTIMSLNSQGTLDASRLDLIVKEHHPDVIVLPERDAVDIRVAAHALGYRAHSAPDAGFSSGYLGDIQPTSMLVSESWQGAWIPAEAPSTAFGTVSVANDQIQLVGLHTAPPLPGMMGRWSADLDGVNQFLRVAPARPVMMAGDFNATARHGLIPAGSGYHDAAAGCGWAAPGTWPVNLPAELGAPIDHVLVSDGIAPLGCRLIEVPGADHRGVLVTLALTA